MSFHNPYVNPYQQAPYRPTIVQAPFPLEPIERQRPILITGNPISTAENLSPTNPLSQSKKFNIQICKINNNRGSFNTTLSTPNTGNFPTIHSLRTKINEIATTSAVGDCQLFYRYGSNKTKILLNESSFNDINWNDERLSFNVTENPKRKLPNTTDDNPKPKKKNPNLKLIIN